MYCLAWIRVYYNRCPVRLIGGKFLLTHTSIRSSNIERSIDFYSRFFGFKVLSRHQNTKNNSQIVFMQNKNGKGAVLEITRYLPETKHHHRTGTLVGLVVHLLGLTKSLQTRLRMRLLLRQLDEGLFDHLGIEVDDLNQTVNFLKAEGATITLKPYKITDGLRAAFVEDPDGTLIELIEERVSLAG